jgi:hypothetical protein
MRLSPGGERRKPLEELDDGSDEKEPMLKVLAGLAGSEECGHQVRQLVCDDASQGGALDPSGDYAGNHI